MLNRGLFVAVFVDAGGEIQTRRVCEIGVFIWVRLQSARGCLTRLSECKQSASEIVDFFNFLIFSLYSCGVCLQFRLVVVEGEAKKKLKVVIEETNKSR